MLSVIAEEQTFAVGTQRNEQLLVVMARVLISGQEWEGQSQLRNKGRLKPTGANER